MESTKLSARVTAYRDAIKSARDAGVTWAQLAALFNADAKYFASVCKAMVAGRYKPCEQLPLPEPEAKRKPTVAVTTTAPATDQATVQNDKKRPLPGQQIPVGDAEALVDAVEATLGTNFFK